MFTLPYMTRAVQHVAVTPEAERGPAETSVSNKPQMCPLTEGSNCLLGEEMRFIPGWRVGECYLA